MIDQPTIRPPRSGFWLGFLGGILGCCVCLAGVALIGPCTCLGMTGLGLFGVAKIVEPETPAATRSVASGTDQTENVRMLVRCLAAGEAVNWECEVREAYRRTREHRSIVLGRGRDIITCVWAGRQADVIIHLATGRRVRVEGIVAAVEENGGACDYMINEAAVTPIAD